MKRRTFITVATLGTGIIALGTAKFLITPFEETAEKLIIKELSFLKVDQGGVKAFVRDYSRVKDRYYRLLVKGYSLLGITSSQSGKIHQLVTNYLLSTDFFSNQMDESRTIKYVELYNPYLRPCVHPFTHRRYPAV